MHLRMCSPGHLREETAVLRNPALLAARGRTDGPNVRQDAASVGILFHKLARTLAPQRGRSNPHKANESPQRQPVHSLLVIYEGYI